MRMFAVMNQKGGVGKTTTAINVAHAVARAGNKVLAIDLDPQGHLTAGLGLLRKQQRGLGDILLDAADPTTVTVVARDGLDVIPAGDRLGEMEHLNKGGAKRGFLLRDAIRDYAAHYDYVFVDCPPSSGILGINALLACQEVLIPVSGDFFALQGLSRLMNIFKYIEETLSTRSEKWVALTRFQERRRLAQDVKNTVMNYFPKHVYQTPIRETVALAECPGFGKTIFEYSAKSNGAQDYMDLAKDILKGKVMH
jgi:chromosome partitioning protein